jgi:hypothetical protein
VAVHILDRYSFVVGFLHAIEDHQRIFRSGGNDNQRTFPDLIWQYGVSASPNASIMSSGKTGKVAAKERPRYLSRQWRIS